jgi:hypothetical protein
MQHVTTKSGPTNAVGPSKSWMFAHLIGVTTIRAISGLSLQTPSVRMTKSAESKTCDLTKSSTARATFGRSDAAP